MWEVASHGKKPYRATPNTLLEDALVQNNLRLERPMRCPEELYQLMTSCWQIAPSARPTAVELWKQLSGASTAEKKKEGRKKKKKKKKKRR